MRVLYAESRHGVDEIVAVLKSLCDLTPQQESAIREIIGDQEINKFLSIADCANRFEDQIASIFGKKYGVFVNSGSSANLIVTQLIPKGEVITPALTFATTLTPLLQCGLTPVFIDSDIRTFLPSIEEIEKAITDKTTAVMIPNLLGNKMDSVRLRKLCDDYNLLYVEDSCDTITNSNGHFVTTSFYGSHIITAMGSGGMVMSDDKEAIDRIRTMRDWGRGVDVSEEVVDRYKYQIDGEPYDGKFWYTERGFNMRPVDAMAAFGLEQLKRFKGFEDRRKINFIKLYDFFSEFEFLNMPISQWNPNWLAFPITLKDAPFTRFELVDYFETNGIQTRPIFSGNITRHPAFREFFKEFPGADYVMKYGVLLGIHQGMDDEQIDYIKQIFNDFIDKV